ncbi:MAG: ABC transporter ATP-binding protein [Candidatus Kariarchaeaceae archaeon]|jgi:ABC-type Fe3+/spermidine/putrescine transport system ATPase subunit
MVEIELQNVVAFKDGIKVLDDVSLKVKDKEYVGLLGPTGSGPSFTLKVIAGILPIHSGKLLFDGEDVTNLPPEDRDTGFIFERFNLFPHMNVMENVMYGPKMKTLDLELKEKETYEILRMVRLDGRENAFPKELSGGMQQRVGIARALVAGAKTLLLDQPYRALDAKIREEMRFEISELVRELELTALHSTHETEEAMIIADKIAIFKEGQLQQFGDSKKLFERPSNEFVASFLAESNVYEGTASGGVVDLGPIQLNSDSELEGQVKVVIRQHGIQISYDGTRLSETNLFEGKITKIRVLGEFIRFHIVLESGFEIISRQLLALEWRNPNRFLGSNVLISMQPSEVKVFQN